MTPVRAPAVAGRFYPESADALLQEIRRHVEDDLEKQEVIGIVAPHAGFVYSGDVAGAVYSRIAIPETVVLIGPNHTGEGERIAVMTEGSWATPLGIVDVDSVLARNILAALPDARSDDRAHVSEHSLETQIPFLQYFRPDIKIVPICLQRLTRELCRSLGQAVASAIQGSDKKVLIVASSDMTHFETHAHASEKDRMAIDRILDRDATGLEEVVRANQISMCGLNPVASLIAAGETLGADRCELVRYMTSGEVSGDMDHVVGYAGLILK